ncbi:MAG: hypothetical protein GYA34_18730 [Chloroflexi bacterium]|nr:hypothetical protein [Chloroflexota bacterium]
MKKHLVSIWEGINNDPKTILLVLCAGLLIYFRDTRYFTNPRFWAEEGTLHFAFSFNHPWFQALVQPQVGYLNFFPNLATVLATFVPLESAPLVTTLAAFVVQLIPITIILLSSSPPWQRWWRKIVGCAVVLFVPLTHEGWLNTINSFTFFAAITFLILLEDAPQTASKRWFFRTLLILAGLSGVLACSLIPLFIIIAWLDKSRERWLQAALLSICSVIQLLVILSFRGGGEIGERFFWIGFSTLGITFWTQSILLFTTGYRNAHEWGKIFRMMIVNQPAQFMLWGKTLFVAALAWIGTATINLKSRVRNLFLYSIAILILLFTVFSIIPDKYSFFNTGLHQRAFLAPNMILGWMLLAGINIPKGKGLMVLIRKSASYLCAVCLALALFWGAVRYFTARVPQSEWYDWRAEVAAWRVDQNYHLRIQPEPWVMELGKK